MALRASIRGLVAAALAVALVAIGACGDEDSAGPSTNGDPAATRVPAAEAHDAGEAHANGPYIAAAEFNDPTTIDNPFSPLTTSKRCELGGKGSRTVRTVMDRTQPFRFDGQEVQAAVIEDLATEDGEVVERTLDYFAQSDDGTVFYLGEDVDNYKNGKIDNHKGSWRLGRDTDVPGVLMPGDPKVGDRWNFEWVPGNTIEANLLEQQFPSKRVGGEAYTDVLKVREHLVLEKETEGKLFARGTGLVREISSDGSHEDFAGCS